MSDERRPLHDAGAERVVLGACMLSHNAIAETLDIISERDFYNPHNATIYRTILNQYADNKPHDAVAIGGALADTGDLNKIGGAVYLISCIELVPTAANASYYARQLRDLSALRRITEAHAHLGQLINTPGLDAPTIADRANAALYEAVAERNTSDLHRIGDLIEPAFKAIEDAGNQDGPTGISTGLADLDAITSGLRGGQLVIVAGRPGMGKTVLATDVARAVALRAHLATIFFSLEMSRQELINRLLAAECSVPLRSITDGKLTDRDWSRLAKRGGEIADAPLYIDDGTDLSLLDIRAKARRLATRETLSLLVIDYLQLMKVTRSRDQREREVAEISRGLKLLAKELDVPVIAVAQLNRGPEGRTSKKPYLSDLRESGSLEQDADLVLLLHRPDYYDKESARSGEVDIDVAKNRGGPTGDVTAAAQLHFARFANMALIDEGGQ